jgi:hypothetical protein
MLGSVMVIYSKDQVWLMEFTGSELVFNFRRLFPTGGILNANCVVEVDGKHFVFGDDDIYIHDGLTKKSLGDGRDRRTIYGNLDRAKLNACYVQYDSVTGLIYFCYPSREADIGFPGTQFCNRAAVYNTTNDTWSFMDMPNTVGGSMINVDLSQNLYLKSGSTIAQLYDTSANAPSGSAPRIAVMLSAPSTTQVTASRVFAVDSVANDVVQLDAHPEVLRTAFVERTGISLDDPGLQLPLRSYKVIDSIVPLLENEGLPTAIRWRMGSADKPKDATVWYSDQAFDPNSDIALDMRVTGRFLSYRMDVTGAENFKLSGFDASVKTISRR